MEALRPRQALFVERMIEAANQLGSALGVAPTGAGKTYCLSAIAAREIEAGRRVLWLQHRLELLKQNHKTFRMLTQGRHKSSIIAAQVKAPPVLGEPAITFAMVQTAAARLEKVGHVLSRFGTIIIDEAHHSAAKTYREIVARAGGETAPRVFGVTATPRRSDGEAYHDVFATIADQITLKELIDDGILVRPVAYRVVVDEETERALEKIEADHKEDDAAAIAKALDNDRVMQKVISEWRGRASGRSTVAFVSTIAHADHVAEAFRKAGVKAEAVHSKIPAKARARILREFDEGKIDLIANPAVLTEGWDCQRVSCVLLLRPCSDQGPLVQMIGRGLRRVDPERYPGVTKTDCVVLDFGRSLLKNGDIGAIYTIDDISRQKATREAPKVERCLIEAEKEADIVDPERVKLVEIDLLTNSSWHWFQIEGGRIWVADGIECYAMIIALAKGGYAVACGSGKQLLVAVRDDIASAKAEGERHLASGRAMQAKKHQSWHGAAATLNQRNMLQRVLKAPPSRKMTKYEASCLTRWLFTRKKVEARLAEIGAI